MKQQRRKFTKEFKLKVILDALKEQLSMKELCKKYNLSSTQITNWKQDFLDKASLIMDSKHPKEEKVDQDKEMQKLYAKIGQQQMDIEFLKKKLF